MSDLLSALVGRPFFLGSVPTSTLLPPAALLPDGCTVYVIDEAKIYINLSDSWRIWPSDTSFSGVYANTSELPDASTLLDGTYALVEATNQIYYVIDGAWQAPLGTMLTMDIIPVSTYYSDPFGDYFLTVEKKRSDGTLYYESHLYYYPSTLIYDTVGRIKISINTLTNEIISTEFVEIDDSTSEIRNLTITREADGANNILTILLGVDEASAATAIIGGATVNGHIDMEIGGSLGEEGNSYTYEVDAIDTAVRALSVTLTDYALVVNLKIVEATAATAIIGGATANGHVDMVISGGLGAEGNLYAITVDADDTAIRAFSIDFTGYSVVVYLKVVEATAAAATIGGATVNGHVDMTVNGGLGAAGNDLTITVDGTLTYYDLVTPASVTKVGNDILVQLKIIGDVAPSAIFFSGVANKELTFTAVNPGLYSDGSWIEINNSTAIIRNLSVEEETPSSHGITNITIYLKVIEDVAASAVIGNPDNANGHIDVVVDGALGSGGNDYSFVVTIASGADQPLSVTQNGTVLNIVLGTDASGFVSLTKNTCTLVAAAINAIVGGSFTATADGTGAEPLTYEQPSTNFSGGTNKLDNTTNTSANIATAFNAACTLVQVVANGDGSGIVTTNVGGSLTGGSNKIDTTVSGDNSAGNIASLLNALAGSPITAVADGDGTVALSAGEALQNFTGGANKIDDTASGDNSAGSIATAINNLIDCPIVATADGTGSVAITAGEVEKNFAGGANKVDDTASGDNSAGNIATVINALIDSPIIATADGDGSVAITAGEVETNFSGGLNEVSTTKNTTTLIIAGIEAILVGGVAYYSCEEITSGNILTAMSNEFGTDGKFYRRTEAYYAEDGITELLSNSYLYTYDSDGNLVSEILE